ncbi:hypothetical protein GCM10027275_37660 [Rhabdobacter roseus]|uniref:Ketosteroid isomerase-like protein n=1 Tax=Rhabdobacter roseus TaxID=1655419 RepID=A0A840TSF5_9BACT|nr:nuclear transport factor 2 family protein [Rhabdobacter roseus]MBB5285825.1 ketosteroid isomerase-like protein [Rhabdobacter roseus]
MKIRSAFATLILALLTFACQPAEDTKKSEGSTQEQNQALAQKVYERFNAHDWAGMANLYSESAEFKDPSLGPDAVTQTRPQIIAKYQELAGMFPDVRDDIVAMYPSADQHVVVEFVSSGTSPDGTSWKLPICTIFTIENGLITRDFTYYDNSKTD